MNDLKVGFARLDITGFKGNYINGYFFERRGKGVVDPLYITAVAFSSGDDTAVVISADLLGMYGLTTGNSDKIANEAAVANGLKEGSVYFHMTHTHTAPMVEFKDELTDYEIFLKHRIFDVIAYALDDMKQVKGIYGSNDGYVENTVFVRRLRMKDGSVQTWGKYEDPNIVDYAEEIDRTLRLVKIERENAKEIIMINFQMHPDTLGGELFCSDYVGALRNKVEATVENSLCVFFDGAEGDLSAYNYKGPAPKEGYEVFTKRIGENIAAEALRIYPDVKPLDFDKIKIYNEYVDFPTKRDPSAVPECKRIIELHESGKDREMYTIEQINCMCSNAYKILRLEEVKCDIMNLRISGIKIGDFCFIGMPCEPFCAIGVDVRKHSKFAVTFVTCQTNGSVGYIAPAISYDEGGYEPASTNIKRGGGEILLESANRVADKLFKE